MCRIWAKTRSARLPCARSAQAENETLRKKCDEMTLKLDEATKKVRHPRPRIPCSSYVPRPLCPLLLSRSRRLAPSPFPRLPVVDWSRPSRCFSPRAQLEELGPTE